MLTPAESDAVVRYERGQERGHVESVFLKFNLPDAQALWLKFTVLQPIGGLQPAVVEVWAIAFNLGPEGQEPFCALKSSFKPHDVQLERDCFYIKIDECEWSHGRAVGCLTSDDGTQSIQWDLTYTTQAEGFRHLPADWMYQGPIPKTKATSPQVDSRFSGTVTVQGRKTTLQEAPGMLGHNWGSCHAESWSWVHCNAWEGGENVAFEAVTSKVKFGPIKMPLLTVCHLRLPGEWITMNGLWRAYRIKSEPNGLQWRMTAQNRKYRLRTSFSAPPERFVGINYYDPDGRVIHCLNSKIADGRLRLDIRTPSGWQERLNVISAGTAAFEVGDRRNTHTIPIRIP